VLFAFVPPGETVKWVSNSILYSILCAFLLEGLRSFFSVCILVYLNRNDAGISAIRNAAYSALLFTILTSPLMIPSYYNDSWDDASPIENILTITFDSLHVILYFCFFLYAWKHPQSRFSRNVWIYALILFQIISSLVYLSGDVFAVFGTNDGFCSYYAADLVSFIITPLLLYLTLITDSQYWRNLGMDIQRSSVDVTSELNHSLLRHVIKPSTNKVSFSPIECLDINILDWSTIKVSHLVGQGAHARVHHAKLEGESVVVKVMHKCDSGLKERDIFVFCREALVSSNFVHENVVRFYGISICPPYLYLVYEWCNSGNLKEFIYNDIPFSRAEEYRLITESLKGLHFLHSIGYVHRDIKPDNFMLHKGMYDSQMSVKLADFGTARFDEQKEMNIFNGTFLYMAPELLGSFPKDLVGWRLNPKKHALKALYGKPADIFAFSITVWEILVAQAPYDDISYRNLSEFCEGVVEKKNRPSIVSIPKRWQPFLLRNWHENPEYRMHSQEMIEELLLIEKDYYSRSSQTTPNTTPAPSLESTISFKEDLVGKPIFSSSFNPTVSPFRFRNASRPTSPTAGMTHASMPNLQSPSLN